MSTIEIDAIIGCDNINL